MQRLECDLARPIFKKLERLQHLLVGHARRHFGSDQVVEVEQADLLVLGCFFLHFAQFFVRDVEAERSKHKFEVVLVDEHLFWFVVGVRAAFVVGEKPERVVYFLVLLFGQSEAGFGFDLGLLHY